MADNNIVDSIDDARGLTTSEMCDLVDRLWDEADRIVDLMVDVIVELWERRDWLGYGGWQELVRARGWDVRAADLRRDARDRFIVTLDGKMPQQAIADVAGVTRERVGQITRAADQLGSGLPNSRSNQFTGVDGKSYPVTRAPRQAGPTPNLPSADEAPGFWFLDPWGRITASILELGRRASQDPQRVDQGIQTFNDIIEAATSERDKLIQSKKHGGLRSIR